jgi:hypothetical protein
MRDLKLKWEKTGREEVDEAAGRRGRMGDQEGGRAARARHGVNRESEGGVGGKCGSTKRG